MKILITGANGFSAFHLILLLSQDPSLQIFRTDVTDCDLTQYSNVENLINSIQPDQIYHLAGSFTNNYQTDYQNNVLSPKNIFDSLLALKIPCGVLLIGSAAEYGIPSANPINENTPLKPVSIYGLTKAFQTSLMQHYVSAHQLDLVMARPFNLMGKGISKALFIGQVYDQIERYKKGEIPKITLGDLSAERDYIPIADAVSSYRKIMKHGLKGAVYNVGSGKPIKISDILLKILNENGLSKEIVEEKNTHKSPVAQIYADIQKLSAL